MEMDEMLRAFGLGVLGCALALSSACGAKKAMTGNNGGGTTGPAGGTAAIGSTGTGATGAVNTGTGATGGGTAAMGGGTAATGGSTGGKGGGTAATGGGAAATSGGAGSTGGAGQTSGGMTCAGAGPAKTGMCKDKATGIYAMKVVMDAWWQDEVQPMGLPIINPGRGKMSIYLMGELTGVCDDGTGGMGTLHACGSELPAFLADVTCDAYQLQIDDAIWDKPTMPRFTTTGMTTGFNPGDTLTLAKASGLVGIFLTASDATWPKSTETTGLKCKDAMGMMQMGMGCFPDQDGDGKPGITVTLKNSGTYPGAMCSCNNMPYTYRGTPTDTLAGAAGACGAGGGVRATEVHVGLRSTLGGSGVIGADCMSGKGDATTPDLAIESRVFSCKSADMGATAADCTDAESQFVDDNVPNWHVLAKGAKPPDPNGMNWPAGIASTAPAKFDVTASVGPISYVVRLGDLNSTFDCAAVRGAAYPQ
jgi:hypothetical protein